MRSSPNDQSGRIHKEAFVVNKIAFYCHTHTFLGGGGPRDLILTLCQTSISVLFALCLLSAVSRFYIRLQIQKQFAIEDGLFVAALCCVICSIVILFSATIDKLYLDQAVAVNLPNADIPPDFVQQSYDSHKWILICLILGWSAIMAVKFGFLFFFRKLIDCLQPLVIYWWLVTAYNVVVFGYGVSVYYLSCPYFHDPRSCKSNKKIKRKRKKKPQIAN